MDPGAASSLVLVTQIDDHAQSVTAVLLSVDVELGGSDDLLLQPDATGLPYTLIAQADVFGYLWLVQLDHQLGGVDADVLTAVEEVRNHDYVGWPVAGPPISERGDIRWRFKQNELARLQKLSASCTRQLIDGEPVASIDPVALRIPDNSEDALAIEEFVVCAYEATRRGQMSVPGWLVDRILSDELVTAYRAAGLFDAYRELMSLAQRWMMHAATQPDPAPGEQDAGYGGDAALWTSRDAYLSHLRQGGIGSAWLMTRYTDISTPVHSQLHTFEKGESMQVTFFTAPSPTGRARKEVG
jgi:hypothetical protein